MKTFCGSSGDSGACSRFAASAICRYRLFTKTGSRRATSGENCIRARRCFRRISSRAIRSGFIIISKARGTLQNDPAYVAAVQTALHRLGYSCGEIDGVFGSETSDAITRLQKNYGMRVTGNLNVAVRARSASAVAYPAPDRRAAPKACAHLVAG